MKHFYFLTLVMLAFILVSCNDDSQEIEVYPNTLEPSTFRLTNTKAVLAENDVWQEYTLSPEQSISIDTTLR